MSNYSDPFGPEAHNTFGITASHSGNKGHYCADWDGLWICEDCDEFDFCLCFEDESEHS